MNKTKLSILIIIVWTLTPLLWQLYTSFSTTESLISPFDNSFKKWTLSNYLELFKTDPPFWRYILNSTILAFTTTINALLLSFPAAYVLSKFNRKAYNQYRIFLFCATLVPYITLFLFLLLVAKYFNLGNNLLALSLPYSFLSLPFGILTLTAALKSIPNQIEDAAILEGFDLYQRLRLIFIPLTMPTIASTSIIIFLFSWNEYPIALTWISNSKLMTLPVAIARIGGSSLYSIPYGTYAAATVLGAIPLLIIVLVFQKQIISGLTEGAIKG